MTYPCRYDSAGPWNGGASCAGGLLDSTRNLGAALVERYEGGRAEGYNCRPNTADASQLSVHGTGRAVDYFPPSMAAGHSAAAWLVANWAKFGIQMVIWNRRDWTCAAGWTSYGGPSPHTDHLHIEQQTAAAHAAHPVSYYLGNDGLMPDDVDRILTKLNKITTDMATRAQIKQVRQRQDTHGRILRALASGNLPSPADLRNAVSKNDEE